MPSWNELLAELNNYKEPQEKIEWFNKSFQESLTEIGKLRGGRNVLCYASAFLQKPNASANFLQLTLEEINGFMASVYGLNCEDGLVLLLHTPGGLTNAVETVVDYLWSKFEYIEVIVPTYAMSAGTMISLASDLIIMGRHSQLGPIDPQMPFMGRYISARAILDQFNQAKKEIDGNTNLSHAWYPVLQSLGPSLVKEADNALHYSERMVAGWLSKRMFKNDTDSVSKGANTAEWFNNANEHKSHGRRINRDEARLHDITILDLESSQALQEAVLTAYHLLTIMWEQSPATKIICNQMGKSWVKNAN